jgi:para-aminobenzoate synthetase/4-amino-4-deoxychorismate lyase
VARTKALIAAGDIYQANVSVEAEVRLLGHPLAAYARLRAASRAGWGGVLFTGAHWLLSASPELFFTLEAGVLTARPMKGTAARGETPAADAEAARHLAVDPKERAENLMIVDLLRNDLARVARPGSVTVPRLFEVETYPTVHQMTSSVIARLADGLGPVDALRTLFPCGSVTGAPKIRAMEVIAEVEDRDRGPYTGSMGWIGGGAAGFNVLIRTLVLADGVDGAALGLGSGVVADSEAAGEWRECLAKGAFVGGAGRAPDLIETMRFDPYDGIERLTLHLERLSASARAFGIAIDRHAIRNELQGATFALQAASRIRLVLGAEGGIAIETGPLPPHPAEPVAVAIMPLPVHPSDYRLRHKTGSRGFYDAARRAAGTFETIFETPDGRLTEGSFTNLFVEREGRLLTPPAAIGLLPGVLRRSLIEDGRAEEAVLTRADLGDGFLVGNALRGLIRARLVDRADVARL